MVVIYPWGTFHSNSLFSFEQFDLQNIDSVSFRFSEMHEALMFDANSDFIPGKKFGWLQVVGVWRDREFSFRGDVGDC